MTESYHIMTEESRKDNEYLLEQLRRCGLFKCTDCLYALWEDRGYGIEYKCCHPRTLQHSAWNDLRHAMFGSACDVFEQSGRACENAADRMEKTAESVKKLIDYAWSKTKITYAHDTHDENTVLSAIEEIKSNGMLRI